MLVEVKVVGSRRAGLEPRAVAAGPSGTVALRALIEHVVRDEVAAYNRRERERRLLRVLSAGEVAAGVRAGKVEPGGRETTGPTDAEAAVANALEAFADGLYFVFVDDVQMPSLDAEADVGPATRLRFVRLVPLAGG